MGFFQLVVPSTGVRIPDSWTTKGLHPMGFGSFARRAVPPAAVRRWQRSWHPVFVTGTVTRRQPPRGQRWFRRIWIPTCRCNGPWMGRWLPFEVWNFAYIFLHHYTVHLLGMGLPWKRQVCVFFAWQEKASTERRCIYRCLVTFKNMWNKNVFFWTLLICIIYI